MKLDRKEGEAVEESMSRFFEERFPNHLGPAALIRTQHGDAIAIRIGENLSRTWQSGDIMCIWPNGEYTAMDGLEVEIIIENLWSLRRDDERR
jgi:hypothetical protein